MNTVPTRRAVAAGGCALALSTLTACGAISDLVPGSSPFLDQTPRSMAAESFQAMQDVTSMRILGDVDSGHLGRMRVDISVGKAGCQGSVDLDDRGGFQLRHNVDGTWMRVDEKFWQSQARTREQGDQAWRTIRDKWIVVEDDKQLLELCDLAEVLAEFAVEPEDTEESLDSDDVVKVGDADAVPVTGGRGKKRTTLWLSVDAPHYVLKMSPAKDKGYPDALFFEEFGVKVAVETPAAKEIFVLPKGRSPV